MNEFIRSVLFSLTLAGLAGCAVPWTAEEQARIDRVNAGLPLYDTAPSAQEAKDAKAAGLRFDGYYVSERRTVPDGGVVEIETVLRFCPDGTVVGGAIIDGHVADEPVAPCGNVNRHHGVFSTKDSRIRFTLLSPIGSDADYVAEITGPTKIRVEADSNGFFAGTGATVYRFRAE